jgi:hypothetical protein
MLTDPGGICIFGCSKSRKRNIEVLNNCRFFIALCMPQVEQSESLQCGRKSYVTWLWPQTNLLTLLQKSRIFSRNCSSISAACTGPRLMTVSQKYWDFCNNERSQLVCESYKCNWSQVHQVQSTTSLACVTVRMKDHAPSCLMLR